MQSLRALFFALIATSVFLGCAENADAAQKKSRESAIESPDPIRDATVNIYCRVKSGNKILSSTGSGVFVGDRGIILTNAHVAQYLLLESSKKVTGGCTVRTGSPAKDTYIVSLLYLPTAWIEENRDELSKKEPRGTGIYDFALISVSGAKRGVLPTSFKDIPVDVAHVAKESEGVTVAGYPADKLDFNDIKKRLFGITASSTVTNVQTFTEAGTADLITLAPSAAGGSGSSGGPIVSTAGNVIGITVAKSTSKENPSLRAITLPYIDRTLMAQTGYNLGSLLLSDFTVRSSRTNALTSPELIRVIEKGVFKKR